MGNNEAEPPWLIMEWIPLDLRAVCIGHEQVAPLLQQVCSGLTYMHEQGFAHRDLKPDNILIDRGTNRFTAKIADVGLSKFSSHGLMQTFAGSFTYMAPELWGTRELKLNYTKAVDVWSMGIIAVELSTQWELEAEMGHKSFSKPQHEEWIRNAVLPRVAQTPANLTPLIHGMLTKSAIDRWTAKQCEDWLQTNIGVEASKEDCLELRERRMRSAHPTLSTTRAINSMARTSRATVSRPRSKERR